MMTGVTCNELVEVLRVSLSRIWGQYRKSEHGGECLCCSFQDAVFSACGCDVASNASSAAQKRSVA